MNNFIRKKFSFIKKKSMAVLLLLIVALIFTSCASGSKTSAPAAQENYSFSESVAYDSRILRLLTAAPENDREVVQKVITKRKYLQTT